MRLLNVSQTVTNASSHWSRPLPTLCSEHLYCRLHNSVKPNFFCASSREGFPQPNKEDQTTDEEFSPCPCCLFFPSCRYPLLLCWKSVEYEVALHINFDNCSRYSRWLIFLSLIGSPVPFLASHSIMSNCYTSVRTSSNHLEHIQRIVWSFKSFERVLALRSSKEMSRNLLISAWSPLFGCEKPSRELAQKKVGFHWIMQTTVIKVKVEITLVESYQTILHRIAYLRIWFWHCPPPVTEWYSVWLTK